MKLTDLLTTYWSQMTLVILAVAYFIKRGLDIKSKKTEINHNLFQQNRITAVKSFFSVYAKAELMWEQIRIYEILEYKLSANEIDRIIIPHLNSLQESTLELKLYFDNDLHKYFEQLTNGIQSINGTLLRLYSSLNPEKSIIVKANEFAAFKEKIILNNKFITEELCRKLKDHYT
jgi:hypothetical protein